MPVKGIVASCIACTALLACSGGKKVVEPIGLVLSGGGARGAYEVGVWQALQAAGLASRITAISGTSVGALNAALFATNPESAEKIWRENMQGVFVVNTNAVGRGAQTFLDTVSEGINVAEETGDNAKGWAYVIGQTFINATSAYIDATEGDAQYEGFIDSSRLEGAVKTSIPEEWPADTPIVYATAVVKSGANERSTWCLNGESHERRIKMLCASAALPGAFDTRRIDGKTYVDGGWEERGGDNIPLMPIIDNHPEIKTVIVVYLKDAQSLDANRRAKNCESASAAGVRLVEIIPSEDINGALGITGTFDTSPETARRLIDLGRRDAEKFCKDLKW